MDLARAKAAYASSGSRLAIRMEIIPQTASDPWLIRVGKPRFIVLLLLRSFPPGTELVLYCPGSFPEEWSVVR